MTNEEKFNLINRRLDEVLTPEGLKELITSGTPLKHYVGFEISGIPHIGHTLIMMQKVKDFVEAGVEVQIFLADWHTWLNKKLDGKFETITRLADTYFKEALIAGYIAVGGDPQDLHFIKGSKFYSEHPDYWATMMEVSRNTTLARIVRSVSIAGRKEEEGMDYAITLYPAMQAADVFAFQANLPHGGTDQRKAHVIAIDTANQITVNCLKDKNGKQIKPIALHSHLLLGIETPKIWPLPPGDKEAFIDSFKMSKSRPNSAIFLHDSPDDIRHKVRQAFAPEGDTELNPVLDWVKYLIFHNPDTTFTIERPEKFGGDVTYTSYEELEKDYADKQLHPQDLKNAVAEWLISKLEPARKYFEDPKRKAALEEITTLTSRSK